jgi:hypothetical protein
MTYYRCDISWRRRLRHMCACAFFERKRHCGPGMNAEKNFLEGGDWKNIKCYGSMEPREDITFVYVVGGKNEQKKKKNLR